MKLKKLNNTTLASVILADDPKKDYQRRVDGEISPVKGIPRSLKPRRNMLSGEIEITRPDGRKEYYKEEKKLGSRKYVKCR